MCGGWCHGKLDSRQGNLHLIGLPGQTALGQQNFRNIWRLRSGRDGCARPIMSRTLQAMFRPFVTSKKAVRVAFNCGWACATRTGRGRGAAPNASVCDDTRRRAVMPTVIAVQHSCQALKWVPEQTACGDRRSSVGSETGNATATFPCRGFARKEC